MRCETRLHRFVAFATVCLGALAAGCQQEIRPVRIGITKLESVLLPVPPFDWALAAARWEVLRTDMGLYLGLEKSVQIELLKPHQIRVHLGTGRVAFALVDAVEYAEIAPGNGDIVLATAVKQSGAPERVGLIVTRADSPIQSLSELKGKRFDFGPKGDPLLDTAAVCALWQAGVKIDDISKDKLLGEYRHLNSQDIAKAVVYGKVPAGIIDEADYRKWPKKGGSLLLGVSQDQLRILQRTDPVPEMVVIASKKADPALVDKVKKYFLEDVHSGLKGLLVLSWFGIEKFVPATPERYAPFVKLVNEVHPPTSQPAEPQGEP
jgi:ABC-type phosphate/phosphonate transport system substrate-binding protein